MPGPGLSSGDTAPSVKNLQLEEEAGLSRDEGSREDVLWGWGGSPLPAWGFR